jgi:acetyl-CoA carboxylase biotin carboxyl carrier protein
MAVDFKELDKIVELMERANLAEVELEQAGSRIHLRRSGCDAVVHTAPTSIVQAQAPVAPSSDPTLQIIRSPIVGTFYRAANPESSAFVQIGSSVNPESVVCIIEAMKVLSEIHAEVSGKIVEILVENGHSVEFGQPLFKVKP